MYMGLTRFVSWCALCRSEEVRKHQNPLRLFCLMVCTVVVWCMIVTSGWWLLFFFYYVWWLSIFLLILDLTKILLDIKLIGFIFRDSSCLEIRRLRELCVIALESRKYDSNYELCQFTWKILLSEVYWAVKQDNFR